MYSRYVFHYECYYTNKNKLVKTPLCEWDMVHVDVPTVFTSKHMAAKGQHYIVHFSSRSGTDSTYTDAIDVNVLPTPMDPALMYGKTNGQWR